MSIEANSNLPQQTFMLDTHVFDRLVDGRLDRSDLDGRTVIVTAVQAAEIGRCRDEIRLEALKGMMASVAPTTLLAASFMLGVDGAGWDQADWTDGSGRGDAMLARLVEVDGKPAHKLTNQLSDIAIAETALKRNAILVSDDAKLRQVYEEFGGVAIETKQLHTHAERASSTKGEMKESTETAT